MKKIALIGNPVSHSLSPSLFKAAYGPQCVINNEEYLYEIVESSSVEDAMEKLRCGNYIGANVTAPYKELVMKYITHPDAISSAIGAANLILFKGDDVFSYNTDYQAALTFAKNAEQPASIYIIGCGGVGKASVSACCNALHPCSKVFLINRTISKAVEYAERIEAAAGVKPTLLPLNDAAKAFLSDPSKNKVLFYTLPCETEFSRKICAEAKKEGHIAEEKWRIVEPNYLNPSLKECAGAANVTYISGLEWLIEQAVYGFLLLAGSAPNKNEMKSLLKSE